MQVLMMFCIRDFLGFVSTQNNKVDEEQVEVGFCNGMLDDILENSIFPADQIVKIRNVNVMILLTFLCNDLPLQYN